ncbi:MAG: ABC transporter ATP-binding protein [bacterium]|nr:ABC transporter ATP-binding protein [bacterium]
MLNVKDLVVETWDKVPLLKKVSIEIRKNKITGLIGESGSGKTILSKTLSALLPETIFFKEGIFSYKGETIDYNRLKKLRGTHIFYTPQNAAASLNPVMKLKHQVNETSKIGPLELIELLKSLGFPDPQRILNAYPFELSGGENQRCLLAIAAALQPELLILDEPTAGLDQHLQGNFIRLVKEIQEQYDLTILLITHNLSIARNISDYVYIILQGEIVEQGTPEDLFSSPVHNYTKEIVRLLLC